MPLGYNNNDGANALDQQQELDFFRGWSVVDAAGGSNLVTAGTGSYDVDVAAGDIHTPSGSVSASAATLDLQSLVDPDLPRIVIVYRDSSGTAQSLAGTPAPKDDAGKTTPAELFQPAPESFVATDGVVCATVLLEAGASEVTAVQIRDRRLPSEVRAESGVFESLSTNSIDSNSVNTEVLGTGRSWTDVTASRAYNATETNNTDSEIIVTVVTEITADNTNIAVSLSVAGNVVDRVKLTQDSSTYQSVSAVVPAGSDYEILAFNTADYEIERWREFK